MEKPEPNRCRDQDFSMRLGFHPAMHSGACSLCGTMVPRNAFECPNCGASWHSWQGPFIRGLRVVFGVPAVFFSVGGLALLVLSLINQAPLDTVKYFIAWIAIGLVCQGISKYLPNTHSGWFQS